MTESTAESVELEDVRAEYSGAFVKVESWYSSYTGAHEQYIVFEDIQGPNLALLRDQQTFCYGKGFRALGLLEPGDRVRFHARIVFFMGMYFKLSRPTKLQKNR